MPIIGKDRTDTAHGKRFGIQDFTDPIFFRRDPTGAICHAAGFSELGDGGTPLNDALIEAAGDMPVIGPNCWGMLNLLDRTANGWLEWKTEAGQTLDAVERKDGSEA